MKDDIKKCKESTDLMIIKTKDAIKAIEDIGMEPPKVMVTALGLYKEIKRLLDKELLNSDDLIRITNALNK